MNFYKTTKWIRKRSIILKRDKYECRECKRYGKVREAKVVHHIYPLEIFLELALININLLSLCSTCHESMHIRKSHELTRKGIEWTNRIGPPHSLKAEK
ncbi:HNH endonuclease [Jeotgalibacillus proteolyticus]|uniref:Putative HNH nuclease YajD n=1 Tax=Jeotgalibacillus proteolyticus TaxID=2082395 RepID=A0A2S5GFW7_9BACL|nr:HNH endonuclease [Jeotgalibacillus proteolyticus]PPA71917.1 HNH endonuclease [Jeotgalibacillus proteolyticus]